LTEEGQVIEGKNFAARSSEVWSRMNHNWMRITRILRSLSLLGLPGQAQAFYQQLKKAARQRQVPDYCGHSPVLDGRNQRDLIGGGTSPAEAQCAATCLLVVPAGAASGQVWAPTPVTKGNFLHYFLLVAPSGLPVSFREIVPCWR